jgi:hypothetical protein
MALAPIILFVYNRPDMVEQTLNGLANNGLASQSELFIFSDGPKVNADPDQIQKINSVRRLIRSRKWCNNVVIVERETNIGLAQSVMDGVTEVLDKYDRVIVVEDDVELSPYFLDYMNDALEAYKDDERILTVGSWNYFAPLDAFESDHFLFRYPDSIAWATYKRSWMLFEKDAKEALQKLQRMKKMSAFNGDNSARYFEEMLRMQIAGQINSWAIRWTATAIIHDKLTVLPRMTMSKHLGFGAEATHEKTDIDYNAHLELGNTRLNIFALESRSESILALHYWIAFVKSNFNLGSNPKLTLMGRMKIKLIGVIKRYVKKNL